MQKYNMPYPGGFGDAAISQSQINLVAAAGGRAAEMERTNTGSS